LRWALFRLPQAQSLALCCYLWIARSFRRLSADDRKHNFFKKSAPLTDRDDIYINTVKDFFLLNGWILENLNEKAAPGEFTDYQSASFDKIMQTVFENYDNAVLLRTYSPTIKLAFATILFDFYPYMTIKTVKTAAEYLKQARFEADNLRNDEGIYSITNLYGKVQSKTHFIECIDRCLAAITDKLSDDPDTPDDSDPIDRKKLNGLKLSLLNIESEDDERVLFA